MPMSSAESMIPSSERGMPHSLVMPGAAKALDSTSNPSSAFRKIISTTTIHWRVLIGFLSTTAIGLVPPVVTAIEAFPRFDSSRRSLSFFA